MHFHRVYVTWYADDLNIMASTNDHVEGTVAALEEEALKFGLKINTEKTKYLHLKRGGAVQQPTSRFEQVSEFRYL